MSECHTSASVTQGAIEAGGDWQRVECGQHWDAALLGAIAIVLCMPFVILAIGMPIVLSVRLLLWLGRLL